MINSWRASLRSLVMISRQPVHFILWDRKFHCRRNVSVDRETRGEKEGQNEKERGRGEREARNMVSFGYQALHVSDRMLLIYPENEIHDKQVSP